jgi:tRNA threonylcarbamoyl adenosine modification protein YeaZ
MPTLALDASSPTVSIALCDGPSTLASRAIAIPPRQSAQLIDAVPALLASANLTFSDLSLIAVGRGPGSYTGLRVAMAAARAWALPRKTRVWTAPGPLATAAALFAANPALDALALAGTVRRGLSWLASFRRDPASPARPVLSSDWQVIPTETLPLASLALPPDTPVDASSLALLHSLGVPSDPLSPLYLNPAVSIPPRYDALTGAPLPPPSP